MKEITGTMLIGISNARTNGNYKRLIMLNTDIVTAKNLEIVSNTISRYSKDTLFGVLDHTVTPMGARLLRTNLLQPSANEEIIQARLDAVQELVSRESLLFNIQSALKPVTDLDHIIADIAKIPAKQNDIQYAESKINHVIRLKAMLSALVSVSASLQSCTNMLLMTVCQVNALSFGYIKQY